MKKTLRKLTFLGTVLCVAQMSFGQMVVVPMSNATGGAPNYPGNKLDNPNYVINDSFLYNINTPLNPYPNTDGGGTDNYFITDDTAADNWWKCDIAIPSGKTLKYLDLYARSGNQTNSGIYNRYSELKITLSDGLLEEVKYWTGIGATPQPGDSNSKNHGRWDIGAAGFSDSMIKNATSLRIDKASDGVSTFLEIQEIRIVAQDDVLGVNDVESTNISVSPNPLQNGFLTIDLTRASTSKVQIYSLLGVLVYEKNAESNQTSIARDAFPSAGLYLIKVGNSVSKVIIK